MATPGVTITAQLQDIMGNAAPDATMRIQLCGFGSQVPSVPGTSLLALATPLPIAPNGEGLISLNLWSNAAITPAGTYYTFTFVDASGNVIQLNAYQFLANGDYDLSNTSQYDPPPPLDIPPNPVLLNPPGAVLQVIEGSITIDGNLIVTGTINSASSPFTVTPSAAPVFDGGAASGGASGFKLTLNQNAAAVFQNMTGKLLVTVRIDQPATGPIYTFAWPANVRNGGQVNGTNGARSVQAFSADTDGSLDALGPMMYTF